MSIINSKILNLLNSPTTSSNDILFPHSVKGIPPYILSLYHQYFPESASAPLPSLHITPPSSTSVTPTSTRETTPTSQELSPLDLSPDERIKATYAQTAARFPAISKGALKPIQAESVKLIKQPKTHPSSHPKKRIRRKTSIEHSEWTTVKKGASAHPVPSKPAFAHPNRFAVLASLEPEIETPNEEIDETGWTKIPGEFHRRKLCTHRRLSKFADYNRFSPLAKLKEEEEQRLRKTPKHKKAHAIATVLLPKTTIETTLIIEEPIPSGNTATKATPEISSAEPSSHRALVDATTTPSENLAARITTVVTLPDTPIETTARVAKEYPSTQPSTTSLEGLAAKIAAEGVIAIQLPAQSAIQSLENSMMESLFDTTLPKEDESEVLDFEEDEAEVLKSNNSAGQIQPNLLQQIRPQVSQRLILPGVLDAMFCNSVRDHSYND